MTVHVNCQFAPDKAHFRETPASRRKTGDPPFDCGGFHIEASPGAQRTNNTLLFPPVQVAVTTTKVRILRISVLPLPVLPV